MPKVSVIMPSLNVVHYIGETIESVLNQTFKDIEVICVDAGSEDGTWELLQEYAKKDERIRLHHSDKRSYGYQMNLGIREATGEYIGIVETDDYIDSRMYDVLYQTACNHDAEVVKSDFDVFTTGKNDVRMFVNYSLKSYNKVSYNEVYSKERYISGESTVEPYIWNAIYKKSFLQQRGIYFNETPGASFQDFGFKYQVAFSANRIVAVNEVFYHYRRDNSGSSSYNSKTMEFNLRESKFLLSVLDEWKADSAVYAAAARDILQYAVWPCMELCKWKEPSPGTKEAVEEYRLLFLLFKEKQWIEEASLDRRLRQGYLSLLDSTTAFDEYIREFSGWERDRMLAFLKLIKSKEQVILYGCGKRGNAVSVLLLNNACDNLVAFCDGDVSKYGSQVNGLEVISPEESIEKYPNAFYVITTAASNEDIKKRLAQLQVEEANRVVYNFLADPLFCTNCMVSK